MRPSSARPRRPADPRRVQLRRRESLHVDHVARGRRRRSRCSRAGASSDALQRPLVAACASRRRAVRQQLVRRVLDPAGDVGVRRAAVGGLYLKPPSSGGLCDGVIDDAVRQPGRAAAVVGEDGVRDDRASACSRRLSSIMTSTPFAASTSSALATPARRARACPCRGTADRRCPACGTHRSPA